LHHLTPKERQSIVRKSERFSWIDGCLFYIGPDLIIKRCVREDEVHEILKSYHDGPCGGHFADKRTGYKVLHQGYYWPTLFRDTKEYVKRCDNFQHMGRPIQTNEMPLQPQMVLEPFDKWAIDFVGPINPSSRQHSYILVCIDYVTKWMEEKSLTQP
jgi:hypothetical protein